MDIAAYQQTDGDERNKMPEPNFKRAQDLVKVKEIDLLSRNQ